jgi:Alginate export
MTGWRPKSHGSMRLTRAAATLWLVAAPQTARADDSSSAPQRPAIMFNRWQEEWSVLADPRFAREPFDEFKYIPLSVADPATYLSFGADTRERFEANNAASTASGDGNTKQAYGTFNPLFPNGYYFTLAGYTGYTNLIHIKPSLTLSPTSSVKIALAGATQWRQSTADAVYAQPDVPVPNTAGRPGAYTGSYGQLRLDWAIDRATSFAVEAVHFKIGEALRNAGGTTPITSASRSSGAGREPWREARRPPISAP